MKTITSFLIIVLTIVSLSSQSQQLNFTDDYVHDSAIDQTTSTRSTVENNLQKTQGIAPAIWFNEFPINHNMHIASDGSFYYTINGGASGSGRIQKFSLAGVLVQTYPILVDGRGLAYNSADGFLYASIFNKNIIKITNLATGAFNTVFTNAMQGLEGVFAISPDGSKYYDFFEGTLYVHNFNTGMITDTITGLSYGTANFGGNATVAVDSTHIYTIDAVAKTVYTYDLAGNFIQTTVLNSGDNGMSLSIANGYLFFAKDGNYATGTWYGYNLFGPTGVGPALNDEATFEIYPNPTNGIVNTRGAADAIEIYNAIGELVFSKTGLTPEEEIDLSNHSKGIYFLRIRNGAESLSKKVIVQ